MNTAILYVWTIVAATQGASAPHAQLYHDWRALGEFTTVQACQFAAAQLHLRPERFRCLRSDGRAE
jgi:hypothetical protein